MPILSNFFCDFFFLTFFYNHCKFIYFYLLYNIFSTQMRRRISNIALLHRIQFAFKIN